MKDDGDDLQFLSDTRRHRCADDNCPQPKRDYHCPFHLTLVTHGVTFNLDQGLSAIWHISKFDENGGIIHYLNAEYWILTVD